MPVKDGLSKYLSRPPRRLLNREDAAYYCAVSVSTFDRVCDVRPIVLSRFSPKLKRFDIRDLDDWIALRKVSNTNTVPSKIDIINGLLE